ncbi:hypothetical protein SEA_NICOLE72_75 [Microbacterium phage Nicole72]|uniref:Uncharacterized protein n=1 Tax=Microbacterium phage Nicole72 TaxID=3062838 RepID=A0ACD4UIM9_9CAUD|nr:hypothetical protein SEA_NICOLE72_75 [Microbacterium phage Nicole72]
MPIANYTTSVPASRTAGQIARMLTDAGAGSVTTLHEDGAIKGLVFGIRTEFGWQEYRVPVRVLPVLAVLEADTSLRPSQRGIAHAERVAWRIAHDWTRAQVALIQAGMATLPEVMFPYTLVAPDTTAFEAYAQRAIE